MSDSDNYYYPIPLPPPPVAARRTAEPGERPPLAKHAGRILSLREHVRELMADGQWRTLTEIRTAVGRSGEASISARLRELRKWFIVEKRLRDANQRGLYEYRLRVLMDEPNWEHA